MSKGLGETQQKILLLLLSGIALGVSRTPRQYFRVLKSAHKAWKQIHQESLRRAINSLYSSKLIKEVRNADGSLTLTLNKDGRKVALKYKLGEMFIKRPLRWDGRWRVAMFDVPEKKKKLRDVFRSHLKELGFHELQKSVFIHPFECLDELDFLIEIHGARKFVRILVVEKIDNDLHLKTIFKI